MKAITKARIKQINSDIRIAKRGKPITAYGVKLKQMKIYDLEMEKERLSKTK